MLLSLFLKHIPFKRLFKLLPERHVMLTVVLAIAMLCVASFMLFYIVLCFQHPFWSSQPVARPTILPCRNGKIHTGLHAMLDTVPSHAEVPEGYVLTRVRQLNQRSETDPLWNELVDLWTNMSTYTHNNDNAMAAAGVHANGHIHGNDQECDECDNCEDVPEPRISQQSVYWTTRYPGAQLFIVRKYHEDIGSGSSQPLVASMICMPTMLDTPVETELEVFLVDRLHVHPEHRGKRLVPALVTAGVSYMKKRREQKTTQRERILAARATETATDSKNAVVATEDSATEDSSVSTTTTSTITSTTTSSDQTHTVVQDSEPVGMFSVELDFHKPGQNRLPFAEVARSMRVYQHIQPALLLDPPAEVSYRIVRHGDRLPTKVHESSSSRLDSRNKMTTLEPTPSSRSRTLWWKYIISHPNHSLLSIGGSNWIHLSHEHAALSHSHHQPHLPPRGTHVVVQLLGSSFDSNTHTKLPAYVYAFIRRQYSTHPTVRRITLVIPQPLQTTFAQHLKHRPDSSPFSSTPVQNHGGGTGTDRMNPDPDSDTRSDDVGMDENVRSNGERNRDRWCHYDSHYIYMYNYRLQQKKLEIPFTFDLPVI